MPDGHQGTLRTLEAMRYLVRKDYRSPYVRSAIQCVWSVFTGPRCSVVEVLFLFARDCIRYVEDPPNIERIADFRTTTELGYGDCDDKTIWLATALLACDVPVRFVVQSQGEQWDHVFLEYYDWERFAWIALDATADGHTGVTGDIGWRQPLPVTGYEMIYEV